MVAVPGQVEQWYAITIAIGLAIGLLSIGILFDLIHIHPLLHGLVYGLAGIAFWIVGLTVIIWIYRRSSAELE